MCNLPDYIDYTVIRQFTTCNPPVYERPLAEDTATFFIYLLLTAGEKCIFFKMGICVVPEYSIVSAGTLKGNVLGTQMICQPLHSGVSITLVDPSEDAAECAFPSLQVHMFLPLI